MKKISKLAKKRKLPSRKEASDWIWEIVLSTIACSTRKGK